MLSIPPRLPSVHNLRRAFELLDANLLAAEPELNSTRWPGHIGDPIKLNLEFLTLYNEARREALAHSFKNSLARRSKNDAPILTANSFRNAVGVSQEAYHGGKDKGGNIVHIHKLRQFADSTGLPYQRFIKVCLEFGLGGGSKWVPLPFTMLGSPKMRVVLARKLDFEMRENLPCMLRRFYARNPNAGSIERLPSCFGVLVPGGSPEGIMATRKAICAACPVWAGCVDMCGAVMMAGPRPKSREERKRITNADRQRRYRRRQAAMDMHSDSV